ncbi:hypothetical protein ACPOLB_08870 [Rubrivivax sp. RP6-9]|uniref:hypothetical protein n=1 Tax=Rubrivivax sp. RP6-9 TaxID=3415750 RepID=UPI003CC57A20
MTLPDVASAIRRGASGPWAPGVIERQGPHLRGGTGIRITLQVDFGALADATAERGRHVIETEARAIARAVRPGLEHDQHH